MFFSFQKKMTRLFRERESHRTEQKSAQVFAAELADERLPAVILPRTQTARSDRPGAAQAALSIEGFDGVTSPSLRLLPAGAKLAGRELHPLKTQAFSRRTMGGRESIGDENG
jgi:hypothetical protein